MIPRPFVFALCAFPVLSACGGGGGGSSETAMDQMQQMGGAPDFTGAHVVLSGSAAELRDVTGTGTGALTFSDGRTTLTDANGFSDGQISDGTAGTFQEIPVIGDFDTVLYSGSYVSGGALFAVTNGVIGPAANAGDFAPSGQATYTGAAEANLEIGGTDWDLDAGSASVTVNFGGNGSVDATLSDFRPIPNVPVDVIKVTGMNLSDDTFAGGTLTLELGGRTVSPLGANQIIETGGALFGNVDGRGQPDEVGGVIFARGDDGRVTAGFVAD